MKILELTRSFYPSIGGMEKFVDDRLKIYQYLGYEYQVITTTHSEKKLVSGKILNAVVYLPSYTPYEIVPSLKEALQTDYDILSVNQVGYYYSDFAIKSAFKNGKKIILTPHFYFHTERYKLIKKFHSKFILPKTMEKVDRIICFTKYETNYWIKNFPFLKEKIEIIPHYFEPPRVKSKSVNNYGDYFLFLGRGEKNKRFDLLITVFNQLQSDYKLVLTLEYDELSEELKKIINQNNKIIVLGRVSEKVKQELLADCATLVLPTDYEAFGIVNLEASYYKRPILLSELEIFKNILDSNGVVYFKNNFENIERAMKRFILLDEKKKTEMGIKNYNNLSNYNFEIVTEKYAHLLDKLL